MKWIAAGILAASAALAGCATPQMPVAAYAPTAAAERHEGRFEVINRVGSHVDSRQTAITAEVTYMMEPTFPEVLEADLSALPASALTGEGGTVVRVVIERAGVGIDRDGFDVMPVVGLASPVRERAFAATADMPIEFEVDGRVERSTVFRHTARAPGRLTTGDSRAAGAGAAVEAFRAEAYERILTEILPRYMP